MSPKTLLIATAALATAAAAQPALAAGGPPDGQPPLRATVMFNLLDRNGDGTIDKGEAGAVTTAIFASLDANGDGTLAKAELDAAMGHMGLGRGGRHGHDDDDGPRWQQGRGGPGPMMGPGQGTMGPPDRDDMAGRGFGPGQGVGPGQAVGPGAGQVGPRRDFASFDTNGDGVISQEEFDAATPMMLGPRR